MTSSEPVPLFLLGVGLIGGSLLTALLKDGSYKITALTRNPAQAEELKKLGVTPLLGSLDDHEKIVKATIENDVIVHTATADDQPSVKAILEGLKPENRRANSPAPVYLHTSGTGEITSDRDGNTPYSKIYSDLHPEDVDALPDEAPHRDVDLLIKNAVDAGKVGDARVAIILPPLIFGIGTGPFNKISIQVPGWIKEARAAKKVSVVGKGISSWNNIHVANLIQAYTIILKHLPSLPSSPPAPLYWFAEENHHTWISLAGAIEEALVAKGLVEKGLTLGAPPTYMGTNSRSSADRIRQLGWKPDPSLPNVWASVASELDEILKAEK